MYWQNRTTNSAINTKVLINSINGRWSYSTLDFFLLSNRTQTANFVFFFCSFVFVVLWTENVWTAKCLIRFIKHNILWLTQQCFCFYSLHICIILTIPRIENYLFVAFLQYITIYFTKTICFLFVKTEKTQSHWELCITEADEYASLNHSSSSLSINSILFIWRFAIDDTFNIFTWIFTSLFLKLDSNAFNPVFVVSVVKLSTQNLSLRWFSNLWNVESMENNLNSKRI